MYICGQIKLGTSPFHRKGLTKDREGKGRNVKASPSSSMCMKVDRESSVFSSQRRGAPEKAKVGRSMPSLKQETGQAIRQEVGSFQRLWQWTSCSGMARGL